MRHALGLLAILAAALNCNAESNGEVLWAVTVGNEAVPQPRISGGYRADSVSGVAVDAGGSVYLAGTTYSQAFPGSSQPAVDLFGELQARVWVGKLKPDGSEFEFVTFLDNATSVCGLALDPAGNIVVAGNVHQIPPDAPASLRAGLLNFDDVFVTKLNTTGTATPFTAYFGGSGFDSAMGLAVDASGAIYVTGTTSSPDFPVTVGAFQLGARAVLPNKTTSFVVKLDSTGTRLIYSTYLGGSGYDLAKSIAVDSSGAAYVAGSADSGAGDFPVTVGAFQTNPGNGFVAKLNPSGSALRYGTYLPYEVSSIAIDASGDAYVTGPAAGDVLPATPGAFQSKPSGRANAFVAKLNPAGSALLYSTYFGGSEDVSPSAIAVDASGAVHFTGSTLGGLPILHAVEPSFYGGVCFEYTESGTTPIGQTYCTDAFAAALNPSGSALLYSTYLNGGDQDTGRAIAVDGQGSVYVAGSGSVLLPISTPVSNGGSAFVVKLGGLQIPPQFTSDSVTNGASFVSGLVPPGGIATVFCSGLTGISGVNQGSGTPLPLGIQGIFVKVGGFRAPLRSGKTERLPPSSRANLPSVPRESLRSMESTARFNIPITARSRRRLPRIKEKR